MQQSSRTRVNLSTRTQDISGVTGVITDLNVTLHNIHSPSLIDMTFVLAGPNNTGVALVSTAGGAGATRANRRLPRSYLTNTTLTFDDEGTSKILGDHQTLAAAYHYKVYSGSYQPSKYSAAKEDLAPLHNDYTYSGIPTHLTNTAFFNPVTNFVFPGINFSETNRLSAFNDISANGSWKLLAFDNLSWHYVYAGAPSLTAVNGGWSLDITTSPTSGAVPEPAEWMLIGLCACGIIALKFKPHMSRLKVFK